jgi:NADH:ubiquinone reductase (H+-translocating)
MMTSKEHSVKHIVIVGAGAGGLELATRLGNTVGKSGDARITLINPTLTHLWKPLWHEVAAGTFDFHEDELNLVVHAYSHHFHFQLGTMVDIDGVNKKILLS